MAGAVAILPTGHHCYGNQKPYGPKPKRKPDQTRAKVLTEATPGTTTRQTTAMAVTATDHTEANRVTATAYTAARVHATRNPAEATLATTIDVTGVILLTDHGFSGSYSSGGLAPRRKPK